MPCVRFDKVVPEHLTIKKPDAKKYKVGESDQTYYNTKKIYLYPEGCVDTLYVEFPPCSIELRKGKEDPKKPGQVNYYIMFKYIYEIDKRLIPNLISEYKEWLLEKYPLDQYPEQPAENYTAEKYPPEKYTPAMLDLIKTVDRLPDSVEIPGVRKFFEETLPGLVKRVRTLMNNYTAVYGDSHKEECVLDFVKWDTDPVSKKRIEGKPPLFSNIKLFTSNPPTFAGAYEGSEVLDYLTMMNQPFIGKPTVLMSHLYTENGGAKSTFQNYMTKAIILKNLESNSMISEEEKKASAIIDETAGASLKKNIGDLLAMAKKARESQIYETAAGASKMTSTGAAVPAPGTVMSPGAATPPPATGTAAKAPPTMTPNTPNTPPITPPAGLTQPSYAQHPGMAPPIQQHQQHPQQQQHPQHQMNTPPGMSNVWAAPPPTVSSFEATFSRPPMGVSNPQQPPQSTAVAQPVGMGMPTNNYPAPGSTGGYSQVAAQSQYAQPPMSAAPPAPYAQPQSMQVQTQYAPYPGYPPTQ